jgi:hypothetical protein
MKLQNIIILALFIFVISSCRNKNMDKNIISENMPKNNYSQEFSEKIEPEMIYPIEYYKNEITKYESNYYGFENTSMKITDLMNISSITKINNIIPGQLTFLVCWLNQKGYVYWMYSFDDEQNIVKHYYCGDFVSFNNYKKLMEKLSGNILKYGTISVNDFNNDGENEIAVYSFYKNIGNVFCVYGFNDGENELEELCLVSVFINYETPFPSVEYIENGFKILEVIDEEYMDLAWNNYMWNKNIGKYIKE